MIRYILFALFFLTIIIVLKDKTRLWAVSLTLSCIGIAISLAIIFEKEGGAGKYHTTLLASSIIAGCSIIACVINFSLKKYIHSKETDSYKK